MSAPKYCTEACVCSSHVRANKYACAASHHHTETLAYIPGPDCPFVLPDAKDRRIAELEAGLSAILSVSNPSVMPTVEDRKYNLALGVARLALSGKPAPPPEPEVCEWTLSDDGKSITRGCDGLEFPYLGGAEDYGLECGGCEKQINEVQPEGGK